MKQIKKSAGILLYRFKNELVEVLLVHPGGPFWKNKDLGAWTIPKGEFTEEENALDAAKREFKEETGLSIDGAFIELQPIKQKGGKMVFAWALQGDLNSVEIESNTFEMEWPPRSGKRQVFPEVDKARWFDIEEAKKKVNEFQSPLIDELVVKLKINP